jgi:hypothetical protein
MSIHAAIAIGLAVYAALVVVAAIYCGVIVGREMNAAEQSEER